MKAIRGFIKVKQLGQAHAGAGWNKHVNKFQKRIGNKVISAGREIGDSA